MNTSQVLSGCGLRIDEYDARSAEYEFSAKNLVAAIGGAEISSYVQSVAAEIGNLTLFTTVEIPPGELPQPRVYVYESGAPGCLVGLVQLEGEGTVLAMDESIKLQVEVSISDEFFANLQDLPLADALKVEIEIEIEIEDGDDADDEEDDGDEEDEEDD